MSATTTNSANIYAQGFSYHTENVEIPYISSRTAGPLDKYLPIGKRWINTLTNSVQSLVGFYFSENTEFAKWVYLTPTFNITTSGTSQNLNAINTTVIAPGTVPSSLVITCENDREGQGFPVGVQTRSTNSFIIYCPQGSNTSTFNFIVFS